ncbi:MAG: L-serine ammonia-lyase, iron-sulfur-dependent, subunit alpha [Breznakia sp.]
MNFVNAKELAALCEMEESLISRVMMKREMEVFETSETEIRLKLQTSLTIMRDGTKAGLENDLKSLGGLIGGEAKKLQAYSESKHNVCGDIMAKAMCYALSISEVNASMGLIVAAPTAGAAGVLPGALMALEDAYQFSEDQLIDALINASAIGYLLTRNACVSGAQGGCQAEVGSAAAMTASAIVELMGGSVKQSMSAAAIALMNLMGLVCDPVGGLVEIPCQMRNVVGTSTALTSAQVALSGISSKIHLDDVIEAMYRVGNALPKELKETALGGVADTRSACDLCADGICKTR